MAIEVEVIIKTCGAVENTSSYKAINNFLVDKAQGNTNGDSPETGDAVISGRLSNGKYLLYGDFVSGPITEESSYDPDTISFRKTP